MRDTDFQRESSGLRVSSCPVTPQRAAGVPHALTRTHGGTAHLARRCRRRNALSFVPGTIWHDRRCTSCRRYRRARSRARFGRDIHKRETSRSDPRSGEKHNSIPGSGEPRILLQYYCCSLGIWSSYPSKRRQQSRAPVIAWVGTI